MKRYLASLLAVVLFFAPAIIAHATPVSWDAVTGSVLQPLNTFRGYVVKATNFTATSSTATNTFPHASTTQLSVSGNTYLPLTGVLKGNGGSSALTVAVNGTDYTLITAKSCNSGDFVSAVTAGGVFTCSTPSFSAITAIGPAGQTQSGSTITMASSTSTTNGLTSALTIVGSGNTLTFTPSLSGTLTVAGGGTGVGTLPASQLLYGAGTGNVQTVATSSHAFSSGGFSTTGTVGALVGGTASTIKQLENRSFTYATTSWTGTTTIPLEVGYGEVWNNVRCFTDTGTLNVDFYHASSHLNGINTQLNASTTVGTIPFSSNNTITSGDATKVDIGTPASSPTKLTCTVNDTI
jgi:hypothetical protein